MNLTTEVTLWTISLSIAVFGAVFGVSATINSKKANKKLTELIATTWIAEESEKLFFTNIKEITKENRLTLIELKKKNCTYQQYNRHGVYTRMNPVPKTVTESLKDTEYSDLIDLYIFLKKEQDINFKSIINSFEVLSTRRIIDRKKVRSLIIHHQNINKHAKLIMKKYVEVTQ